MLESLINEVKEYDYTIFDDGSSFKLNKNFHQFQHGGKEKFWQKWDYALRMLRDDHSDLFIFMPSDVSNINMPKIIELHNQFKSKAYAYNLINDGRKNCWNMIKPVQVDEHTIKVGFTDCGFFCNKQLLNRIGYYVNEINPRRFAYNDAISSGVGQDLTFRMMRTNCNMFTPTKSLVHHGDHESLMHPTERKRTPLISK